MIERTRRYLLSFQLDPRPEVYCETRRRDKESLRLTANKVKDDADKTNFGGTSFFDSPFLFERK